MDSTGLLTRLGLDDNDNSDSINAIATFGIRSLDYAYTQVSSQTNAVAVGGMAHAVFPISASITTEVLYISQYNEVSDRWERFERGTHIDDFADIWYVVDRSGGRTMPNRH